MKRSDNRLRNGERKKENQSIRRKKREIRKLQDFESGKKIPQAPPGVTSRKNQERAPSLNLKRVVAGKVSTNSLRMAKGVIKQGTGRRRLHQEELFGGLIRDEGGRPHMIHIPPRKKGGHSLQQVAKKSLRENTRTRKHAWPARSINPLLQEWEEERAR